jgi:hypothetical protein
MISPVNAIKKATLDERPRLLSSLCATSIQAQISHSSGDDGLLGLFADSDHKQHVIVSL